MEIYSAEEMNRIDEYVIDTLGVDQCILMEHAAMAVVKYIPEPSDKKVLIVCGTGNNGGDGIALGRLLLDLGANVKVWLLKDPAVCKPSVQKQLKLYQNFGGETVHSLPEEPFDVIVDAIFGVGLNNAPREEYIRIFQSLDLKAKKDLSRVLSIDIPSGVNTDTGRIPGGSSVSADATVTFTALKPGLLLSPGKEACGTVYVESIGVDSVLTGALSEQRPVSFCFYNEKPKLKKRDPASNKGSFHRIAVFAGSEGMPGAALLCAEAALRSGAGIVDVYTHKENKNLVLNALPEAIVHTYEDGEDVIHAAKEDLKKADVIVAGPGLSVSDTAGGIIQGILLGDEKKPLVLDADGLNLLSGHDGLKEALKAYAKETEVVLTPHPKELSRLSGIPVQELLSDYAGNIRRLAGEWGVILVGKGNTTLVSNGRKIYYNLSGNDGMATAGSGDVLSGLVGGFLRNENSVYDAVCLAVYMHGFYADKAAEVFGHRGMLSGDIIGAMKESEQSV